MRNVPTLLRRELNAYFASVIGYLVIMFFLIVMGLFFKEVVKYVSRAPTQITVMRVVFSIYWLPALVVVPAITMRLIAEEKRAGTIEMLMTAPVTDFEVVSAKWLGAVVLYLLMWALTGFYILILEYYSGGTQLDLGPVASGYLGVFLVGQFLISLGLFASSLTKNQIAAALMSFALVFIFTLFFYWESSFEAGGKWGEFIRYFSPFQHMDEFARGLVDARPLVLYASGTALALFLTTRVVESRKWR